MILARGSFDLPQKEGTGSSHGPFQSQLTEAGCGEESRSNIKISMALHMCVCASVCVFLVISTCSLPVSSDHWIFQARILKQVAIFYSKGSYRFRGQTLISCVSCIGRFFTLRHLGSLYVCICVYICMCVCVCVCSFSITKLWTISGSFQSKA